MADRENVINALGRCESYGYCEDRNCPYYENTQCLELLRKDALILLKEQPEIVRCEDCKYNSGKCNGLYLQFVTCYKTGSPHKEDWFCADGVRK